MRLILGSHRPLWLPYPDRPVIMVSRNTLPTKRFPVASSPWVLDSGGFTELSLHGRWTINATEYVDKVSLYSERIGKLEWASPQDWMCEPVMLEKTGKSVSEHQDLTIENFLELRNIAPELPFIPVLQGWVLSDYEKCIEKYASAGVDLQAEPLVGVGSVCRRQATDEAVEIFSTLHGAGISIHGFGVKAQGIAKSGEFLTSADSMAWSRAARFAAPREGTCGKLCPNGQPIKSCANCYHYALRWYEDIQSRMG